MKRIFRTIFCIAISLALVVPFVSCGKKNEDKGTSKEERIDNVEAATEASYSPVPSIDRTKEKIGKDYMIMMVDTEASQIMLRDIENGRALLYSYSLYTEFKDKYDGAVSITEYYPGRICTIKDVEKDGLLNELALSDKVWEMDKVDNYSIDIERGVFTLGVTNYRIPEEIQVFSGSLQTDVSQIGENDILRIVGQDKDIWSIAVTTGHGNIVLVNTGTFNGSLIAIGDIYTLIKGDSVIEVPEGIYNVTVANNGYGGTVEVEVTRGAQVTLDLETLKGEQKVCKLKFNIEVEDAVIKLDGKKVKKNKNNKIPYGKHTLTVTAPGYESWTKYIYVNSPKATIMLTMEEEGSSNNKTTTESPSASPSTSPSTSASPAPSTTPSAESTDDAQKRKETELEYLTTIRDTVSTMMNNMSL